MLCKVCFFFVLASSLYAHSSGSLSVASGIYDFPREKWRTWEVLMEYKFRLGWAPIRQLELRPLVGAMGTIRGSAYLYGGINFDLLFCNHLLISPGFAAGYYWRGSGKDLGYPLEFRSGIELGWQFGEGYRIGIHFYHLSNASLGKKNPGEESLVIFYDIPISKVFPFNCNRDKN